MTQMGALLGPWFLVSQISKFTEGTEIIIDRVWNTLVLFKQENFLEIEKQKFFLRIEIGSEAKSVTAEVGAQL